MSKKQKYTKLETPKVLAESFSRAHRLYIGPGAGIKCELTLPLNHVRNLDKYIADFGIRLREQNEKLHPSSESLPKGGIVNRVYSESDELVISKPELIAAYLEQMDRYAGDKKNKCQPVIFDIHRATILTEPVKINNIEYTPNKDDVAECPQALKELMDKIGLNTPATFSQLRLFDVDEEKNSHTAKENKRKSKKNQDKKSGYKHLAIKGDTDLSQLVLDHFVGKAASIFHQKATFGRKSGSGLTAI